MNNIACFPGKYIQGSGSILQLEQLINRFGHKAIILASPTARKFLPEQFFHSPLSQQLVVETFGGESSEPALTDFMNRIQIEQADVVVGMGGGKTIDTAKIAADRLGLPVIIVPTIASTDAPCSGCAVTYTHEGEFEKVHYQRLNPSVVLVDMEIIARAPTRFLVAGMGDALATWFEARSCAANDEQNECGGFSTLAGQKLAQLCYDVLLKYGVQAKADNEATIISPALNYITEANILLSGIGFESGGIASAHAIHNGFTALPETHAYYHGEKVAFGLQAGLQMIHAPEEEIREVVAFCHSVGLPISLAAIGLDQLSKEKLMIVARKSTEQGSTIHHEGKDITPEKVFEAIVKADAYGKHFASVHE
ncbi:MAG: glycerol dehydrogenase [Bacteroidales bacterium]|nr:glycerol dehydrogenase [Bacteroidales bacterium]